MLENEPRMAATAVVVWRSENSCKLNERFFYRRLNFSIHNFIAVHKRPETGSELLVNNRRRPIFAALAFIAIVVIPDRSISFELEN